MDQEIKLADGLRVFYENDNGAMEPYVWHVDFDDERESFTNKNDALDFAQNLIENVSDPYTHQNGDY